MHSSFVTLITGLLAVLVGGSSCVAMIVPSRHHWIPHWLWPQEATDPHAPRWLRFLIQTSITMCYLSAGATLLITALMGAASYTERAPIYWMGTSILGVALCTMIGVRVFYWGVYRRQRDQNQTNG